tara:strand:- start:344 stop:817 length:474 start_codon:yes stop_codon:yes gene_type:complete
MEPQLYYFIIALCIIFLLFKLYNKSCDHYKNQIKTHTSHFNSLNKKKEVNKIQKSTHNFIEEPISIKNTLSDTNMVSDLKMCIKKIKEDDPHTFVMGSTYKSNDIAFNLNDMKTDKDDNNNKITSIKKMARLNCKYFDVLNDSLNKSLVPNGNLFIT